MYSKQAEKGVFKMKEIIFAIAMAITLLCAILILIYINYSSKSKDKINAAYSQLDNAQLSVKELDSIIETSVVCVNQKMVSTLKRSKSFAQSDKEEAFNECKNMVLSMTPSDTLENLKSLGMDTEEWLDARIEYFVRKYKNTVIK